MLKGIYLYSKEEVFPRWRGLIFSFHFLASVGVFIWVYFFMAHVQDANVFKELPGLVLTYASISFGFCLAGLTLVLTFPDREFTKKLISSTLEGKGDAFSQLLFVFSWAALCHWFLVVIVLVWILAPKLNWLFFSLTIALSVYCFQRFLITLLTLSQLGKVYLKQHK